MTQTHSIDSLYNFIINVQNMDELDAQIKEKEDRLNYLSQLEDLYESLELTEMLDLTTEKYNRTAVEVILLKMKRNELERKVLNFQLSALIDD